ncbi:histone promoter control protein [Grosmannia clavigera kw1407]|uniref:Histone promoter control protein n=1 Tax=Grosmannia clavigera (strain kw1407 / UAMH 11150) TaxID=655863 RepID=F0XG18_GROCL|nr:histone promoter control protein [Grosmannia clavigera kw1407]EFX03413.1 histone promoter control protein [Grosmannia clavigera kw1407]
MATTDRDVEMASYHYSSSPELSSLPSDSPSDPGSPSRLEQQRAGLSQRNEIVVDATSTTRFPPTQSQQAVQLQPFSAEGVRLTKDGIPRKKPGRKPGTTVKKAGDVTAPSAGAAAAAAVGAGSVVDAAKPRRVRKLQNSNAPPVSRKKRAQPSSAPVSEAGAPRSLSALPFPPKIELTSMRMDIDSRSPPAPMAIPIPSSVPQQPRQPPLAVVGKLPKRDAIPNSMQSILNSDSPPRVSPPAAPTATTPLRSRYDPVRSSYDPVRGTVVPHHTYGTGPLGSPHGPTQGPNRASASPSIASLVDPNPEPHTRSSAATSLSRHHSPPSYNTSATTSSTNAQPPCRDSISSLPPSPSASPGILNSLASTSSQSQPTSTKAKTAALMATNSMPASTSLTATATATAPAPIYKSSSSTSTKAALKSESNGKPHGRPPPPPPIPAAAKSTSKSASTKTAAQKTSTSKASAAAATATENGTAKLSGSVTTSIRDVTMTGLSSTTAAQSTSLAPTIKKFSPILQQDRGSKQNKAAGTALSPKMTGVKDDATLQPVAPDAMSSPDSGNASTNNEPERSILDFGKARPGEEMQAPSIVLHIPLTSGENNKYVNFMRMAEDHYGWDALHPRLAAHRDRKARIAAASAALERNGSGRESGDEMTDDMQSGDEGSNDDNGLIGENSIISIGGGGAEDAPAKPVRKKRMFKEDEYDKDDDFVDDSEMLWEEQAAASRDGFFVYSGPLVPEEEKPDEGSAPPTKRGRGGRGSRGGAGRTTAARSAGTRSNGTSGARSSAPARKPRATKQEKEQREREKADNDKATHLAASKAAANNSIDLRLSLPSVMAVDA